MLSGRKGGRRPATPAGVVDGNEFQIAATADDEEWAKVEADETGGGVVFWHRDRGGTDLNDVYSRWLGSDGTPTRDPLVIQEAEDNQQNPVAAGDEGKYLIVWRDDRNGNWDLYGARYERLQASFAATPTLGTAPLAVQFSDTSTPAGTADAWGWAFGAGDSSVVQHPVYTYTVPGQYTVTLNITDTDSGETAGLTETSQNPGRFASRIYCPADSIRVQSTGYLESNSGGAHNGEADEKRAFPLR